MLMHNFLIRSFKYNVLLIIISIKNLILCDKMKIIERGKIINENLKHPVSAWYIQRGDSESTGFEMLLQMFGINLF